MKLPEKDVHFVDLPELQETFVDSMAATSFFDGKTVRMTLCITRINAPTPPKPPTAKRYPVCRLVLDPEVVLELHNQLNNVVAGMEKLGLVKREGANVMAQDPKQVN